MTTNIDLLKVSLGETNSPIVLLSETHLTEEISDECVSIDSYKMYRTDSTSRHTGGVVIYIKNEITVVDAERIIEHMNTWLIAVKIKHQNFSATIACVYHSPNSCHRTFVERLNAWLQEKVEADEKILLFGDMNIDWLTNSANKNRLHNSINDNGLTQMIDKFTRITDESNTLVDYCITNMNNLRVEIKPELNISDHECIVCEILNTNNFSDTFKQVEFLKNYKKQELTDELNKIDWNACNNKPFLEKCDFLVNGLKQTVSKFIKKKSILINAKCKWYDKEVAELKKVRDISYKKAQQTGDINDWNLYKFNRNKYVDKLRSKEVKYYHELIEESEGDNKKMWRALKEVMGKTSKSDINTIKFHDNIISDPKLIANNLNSFFVESIKEISESIPIVSASPAAQIDDNNVKFTFSEINVKDISDAIKQINSKGDLEKITPQVLCDSLSVVGDLFCKIINESFTNGVFPNWKCSTITPVEKISGAIQPEDFRPINNLPAYEKVIEIIAKNQLENFVNDNRILADNQSGFRKNHSCETALNFVIQDWKDEIDSGKIIICVFLDLKRAFETIDRDLLLEKLKNYGITGNEISWFESFLKQRLQRTKIKECISEVIVNDIGLAQGTVLAALLFVLYINDVNNVIKNGNESKLKLFADDTLLYICTDNIDDGIVKINETLSNLNEYLSKNKLKLNVNKTKAMIIKRNRTIINKDSIKICIKDDNIELVNAMKYLGVFIDENLDMNKNIDYICNKTSKKTGLLNRLRNKIGVQQKICIYKTIIAPHFDYCASINFTCNEGQIHRLQLLQNRAMRAIMKVNRYTSVRLMLDTLEWLSVRQRLALLTLKLIHKMCTGQAPEYLCKRIVKRGQTNSYNLRNCDNLNVQMCTKTSTQNSVSIKGFNLYNQIPNEIKMQTNMAKFKRELVKWIKTNIEM